MFSFNVNYTISDALHGMVTNFKVIEDLPEDVQETYGNARKNIEQAYYLPIVIGIVAILYMLWQKNAQVFGRFFNYWLLSEGNSDNAIFAIFFICFW